jgi:hypothetical protein
MSRAEYENEMQALIASHEGAIKALQMRYAKAYDKFRVGDLVRGVNGWRSYFKIKKIAHFVEGHELYTVLTVVTVKKSGETYSNSFENTVRDEDVILMERPVNP